MDPIRIATYGFPGAISELIARGSMQLPTIQGEDDSEFLQAMTTAVVNLFWMQFIEDLPSSIRDKGFSLIENGEPKKIQEWMEKHCNILEDEKSTQRANRILAQLEVQLPEIMRDEQKIFNAV